MYLRDMNCVEIQNLVKMFGHLRDFRASEHFEINERFGQMGMSDWHQNLTTRRISECLKETCKLRAILFDFL